MGVPSRVIHLQQDRRRFGREFPDVHDYMDRGWPELGVRHRQIGHDMTTVEEIRSRWGPEAAKAAVWHIRDDYTPVVMVASLPTYLTEILSRRR